MSKTPIKYFVFALLLSACGPGGLNAEESLGTAQVLAATQIVATQRAQPTNTFPPPPPTLTPPPSPTETALPTATSLPTETSPPPAPPSSATPWVNPNQISLLRFENNTDEIIFIVLSGRVYGEYKFSDSWNLTTPWGDYEYLVWIGNEGPYAGSFRITNGDKYTLKIDPGNVHMLGP